MAPARLPGWLAGFAERHGDTAARYHESAGDGAALLVQAADGAAARLVPPLPWPAPPAGVDPAEAFCDHVNQPRTVGALLIRRGGVAVGVFVGRELVASKVRSGYVQGRTKAGGWSQSRYARRRDHQASQGHAAAADLVTRLVLPRLPDLDGLATGGDRSGITAVLSDPRLERLRSRRLPRHLPVPDPRLAVLRSIPDAFLAVDVHLNARA